MVRITLNKPYIPIPVPVTDGLELTYDDIVNVPVADASSVSQWNTFFDLPTNGTPFTSVEVDGNKITLVGGSNIVCTTGLFSKNNYIGDYERHLVSVIDNGCIIEFGNNCFYNPGGFTSLTTVKSTTVEVIGNYCFYEQYALVSFDCPNVNTIGEEILWGALSGQIINLPLVINVPYQAFWQCQAEEINLDSAISFAEKALWGCSNLKTINAPLCETTGTDCFNGAVSLETLYIPSCIELGPSTIYNGVFLGISGQTITLTIPAALMTCNGGKPDGDIQYLQANNTVTIVTV